MKDKRIIFYQYINELDNKNYLSYYLKYQLAPVIMGFKPSATITLGKQKGRTIKKEESLKVIEGLGLKAVILRESEETHIVLAYRECMLEKLFTQDEVSSFLKELNYDLSSISAAIDCLVKRYECIHCPHELGLFLGFDLKDVKDYMSTPNKICLLCGYWRVYNNVAKAEAIFKQYDWAKQNMLGHLISELEKVS